MADAKRCDICGKYYGLDYIDSGRPMSYGNYVDGLNLMCYKYQKILGRYDLCEDCADDLLAFIKQHKKEGDNEH